ncbi:hypothetical protein MHYP_G00144460 [Metynnis hypsauchen]
MLVIFGVLLMCTEAAVAAVSSVEVTDSCFSSKKRRVSCSSDGDSLHFSWTLSEIAKVADGNKTLLLDTVGNVTCHVKNHVSRGHKTIELQKCPRKINSVS